MPIPDDFQLPEPKEFPVVEDDTYQVIITDIEDVEGKNYNTGEPEPQLKFSFKIVDEGEDFGKILVKWVTMKYAPAKTGRSESNLYSIVTKVFKENIARDKIKWNEMIGKQLRLVVIKVEKDGIFRNKITGYMSSKKDVKVPEVNTNSGNEDIKLEDIPF